MGLSSVASFTPLENEGEKKKRKSWLPFLFILLHTPSAVKYVYIQSSEYITLDDMDLYIFGTVWSFFLFPPSFFYLGVFIFFFFSF